MLDSLPVITPETHFTPSHVTNEPNSLLLSYSQQFVLFQLNIGFKLFLTYCRLFLFIYYLFLLHSHSFILFLEEHF